MSFDYPLSKQEVFVSFVDRLREIAPEVATAFRGLREAADAAGPLDAKQRELTLLTGFAATRNEGGFRVVTTAEAPPNVKVVDDIGVVTGGPVSGIAYVMAPDEMKVELLEMKAQAAPVASHHVHFAGMNKEMQAWYLQTFGAREAPSANPAAFVSAQLPGVLLNFTPAASVVGTEGRVIDHIGFEVKGLEAFLKQLEAKGTKPTVSYRRIEALGIAIAFVTDPWGTRIELSEGLDKVN
jgi:hypothetical protein